MTLVALDLSTGRQVQLLCDYVDLPQGSLGVVLGVTDLGEHHHFVTVSFLGGKILDFDYGDALEMLLLLAE